MRRCVHLIDGVSGKERHRLLNLRQDFTQLQRDKAQLQQEFQEWVDYADCEIKMLRIAKQEAETQRDGAWIQVASLEEEIRELNHQLAWHRGKLESLEKRRLKQSGEPKVSLAGWKIAVVGGHDATRRGVGKILREQHGLTDYVEVPPLSEASAKQAQVKAKVSGCDLIVLVAGYSSHPLSQSVMRLKEKGALEGEVLPLDCRGRSGVLREIVDHVRRYALKQAQ